MQNQQYINVEINFLRNMLIRLNNGDGSFPNMLMIWGNFNTLTHKKLKENVIDTALTNLNNKYYFHPDFVKQLYLNYSSNDSDKVSTFYKKDHAVWLKSKSDLYKIIQVDNINRFFIFLDTILYVNALKFIKKEVNMCGKTLYFNEKIIDKDKDLRTLFPNDFVKLNSQVKIDSKTKETTHVCLGSIYLIRTREFLTQNLSIYKIGKTGNDISQRLGNYGKGGQVLFTIAVENSKIDEIEQKLIELFKTKFIQRIDIGSEYFEGDYKTMYKEIYNFVNN